MRAYITVLDGDADLVPYFVRHYSYLGATLFPVLTYSDEPGEMTRICDLVREAGGKPISLTSFRSAVFSARHRDAYIKTVHRAAGDGWAFFADLDEFAELTPDRVRELVGFGDQLVSGRWLDRVALGGKLADVQPGVPLEQTYPHGCDTRKQLRAGNLVYVLSPKGPGLHHPYACGYGRNKWKRSPCVPVHHFKWQTNVITRLRRRLERIVAKRQASGVKHNAWYGRVKKTLDYLESHGGGVDPAKTWYVGSLLGV